MPRSTKSGKTMEKSIDLNPEQIKKHLGSYAEFVVEDVIDKKSSIDEIRFGQIKDKVKRVKEKEITFSVSKIEFLHKNKAEKTLQPGKIIDFTYLKNKEKPAEKDGDGKIVKEAIPVSKLPP